MKNFPNPGRDITARERKKNNIRNTKQRKDSSARTRDKTRNGKLRHGYPGTVVGAAG